VGAVNLAGGFVLSNDRAQMTVLKAIALAQSIKSTAAPQRAMIIRKSPNSPEGTEQIPLDLSKILKGRLPDRKLLADDILVVPDSASKKALHRAAEAAAQASSLVIYRVP
jgi:polysaccharide biosynthesis/export protein